MKRILLIFLLCFYTLFGFSQAISVTNSAPAPSPTPNVYTVTELINEVLLSVNGSASCGGTVSNVTWSTGTNFGSTNGIGYFSNANPGFNMTQGVVLSTGTASASAGPNGNTQSNGNFGTWPGDAQLLTYLQNTTPPVASATEVYMNATKLEFDFIPYTDNMSFKFIFASEEYGVFQCSYSDSFAFFLNDVTTGSAPVNLAVLPGIIPEVPISVTTIRDNANNAGCPSENPLFFGVFNNESNTPITATNFNGETIKLTASSPVIPGNTYHLKMVIQDRGDNALDSAVFIGEFDIGQPNISGATTEFGGLNDFTIANGTALCFQGTREIKAGLTPIPGASYQWDLGGVDIPGATNYTYTIDQPGTYGVTISFVGGCEQYDTITAEFLPAMPLGNPIDLFSGSTNFDLTANNSLMLNGQSAVDYIFTFHDNLLDAQAGSSPISSATNYNSSATVAIPQEIFVSIQDDASGTDCRETRSFFLYVVPPIPVQPPDMEVCDDSSNDGIDIFDLTTQTPIILSGVPNPGDYIVTYHTSQFGADNQLDTINPDFNYQNASNPETVYVRMEDITDPTSYGTTNFDLIINALPTATISNSYSICTGNTATVTFTGTPNTTVNYTVNGIPATINIDGTGIAVLNTGALFVNTTFDIIDIVNVSTTCVGLPGAAFSTDILIDPLPTATISGTTSVCLNSPNPNITLTGVIGIAPFTFTYAINGVTQPTAQTVTGNSVTIAAPTNVAGEFDYTLISVQDSGAAFCSQSQTGLATISVTPLPTATITSSTPSVCLNYPISPIITLTGSAGTAPYTFTYTENGTLFTTSPPVSNSYPISVPTTTVGPVVYNLVSVTDANGCSQNINQVVTVTVLTAPLFNIPVAYELCDDDSNDGIECFDLNGVVTPQVTSNPTLQVSYHETFTDAEQGDYPKPSPYCNVNSLNNQTIWIRIFDPSAPTCPSITSVQLIVQDKPIAIEDLELHECDDNDALLGITRFTLTDINTQILGVNNPATHTVTFYENLADAQAPTNPIGPIYHNTTANTQTIWVRVETTATGCHDIEELELVVDPLPLLTQPVCNSIPYTICENGTSTGFETFDLQTRVACILNGQLGMSVHFYPTLGDAQNDPPTNEITNLNYTNTTAFVQTLGIRLTNDTTGCYITSTLDIRVAPLPVPIAPPVALTTVCDSDVNGFSQFDLTLLDAHILGSNPDGNVITYHLTKPDAENGANAILNPAVFNNNIPFMQTIWCAVVNPLTLCRGIMAIQLKVNESPRMPLVLELPPLCDEDSNNQDGITSVNLTVLTPIILAEQTLLPLSNYIIKYYTTQVDADANNGNNIINTATYQGQNNQPIWAVVENTVTNCFDVKQFTIIINIPLALVTPPILAVCDTDNLPNDGRTTFDLTERNNEITNNLTGYTVTYYPSPVTLANLASSVAIANPTAYINENPLPAGAQTLGVMVTSAQGCRSFTTLTIQVLPVPTPNTTNIKILPPQCENTIGSGQNVFDLTLNATYIQNNDLGVTLHYYHTLEDAQSIPSVNEILTPTTALIGDITLVNPPRLVNQVQYVYIKVTSNLFSDFNNEKCYTIVKQPFIVNPLPVPVAIGQRQICEEDAGVNDGIEVFDLTSYTADILDDTGNTTIPSSSYVVTFYTDAGLTNPIANPSAYPNSTNPQTIYVSVRSTNTYTDPIVAGLTYTTNCSSTTSFSIKVNPKPELKVPADFATCDTEVDDNDGYYLYPLDVLNPGILNGQLAADFEVTFYHSELDAEQATDAIVNLADYQARTRTIWIRIENKITKCYKTGFFNIIVEQLPTPIIETVDDIRVFCVDFLTQAVERPLRLTIRNATEPYLNEPTVPRPTYTYQWLEDGVPIPGATNDYYDLVPLNGDQPNIISDFTVTMTSTSLPAPPLGCPSTSPEFEVIQSGQAIIPVGTTGYTVTNAFSDNQIITIAIDGWGTYQYSLDDGPRQDSEIFENVSLGEHTVTVWDTEGGLDNSCDELLIQGVQTIDYPHYFTPNGDGIHDTWNIVGLGGQPTAIIYIFDRHGKLLKQISSQGTGWDGTYNNQLLPSTDYWFTVDYSEQSAIKQFKAHFSLKR